MSKHIPIKARANKPTTADQWVDSKSGSSRYEPKGPQKRVTVDIDADLHRELKIYCVTQDIRDRFTRSRN